MYSTISRGTLKIICRTIGFHRNPGWEAVPQAKYGRVPLLNQDAFPQIIYSCSMMNDITIQCYDSIVKKSQTIATSANFCEELVSSVGILHSMR